MSARKIIPKSGRVCLAKDGTRIPPEGLDVDMSVPDLAVWATRLVDVHGDATFAVEPAPPTADVKVGEVPAAEPAVLVPAIDPPPEPAVKAPVADAVTPVAEPEVKPERARSRKGDA